MSARLAEGTTALATAIDGFLQWQHATGRDRRRRDERVRAQVLRLAAEQLRAELVEQPQLEGLVQAVAEGRRTPEEAAAGLLEALLRRGA